MADLMEEMFHLSKAEHIRSGAIHDAVQDIAEHLDVSMPEVHIAPSRIPNAFAIAHATGKRQLVLTQGTIDLMHSSNGASAELRAIIGHELGHIKPSGNIFLPLITFIASPLVAMQGYGLLRSFGFIDANKHIIVAKGGLFGQEGDNLTLRETKKQKIARYAAVGAGGLLAGGVASRTMAQNAEFMCDKVGATVSSPEAMKTALQRLEADDTAAKFFSSKTPEEMQKILSHPATIFSILGELTFSSHPSTEARLARLDKLAEEVAKNPQTLLSSARNLQGFVMPLLEKAMRLI